MTKHPYLTLLLGVPLVCAALTSSFVYAWNSLTVDPAPVRADGAGVDGKEGFTVTTWKSDSGSEYLVVSNYAKYQADGQMRHFLTLYEVKSRSGKSDLVLVGSRCIDWDRGFELVNFPPDKKNRPDVLRKQYEAAAPTETDD